MSDRPLPEVVKQVKKYRTNSSPVAPEASALWFYCQNHAYSVISRKAFKFEPLADPLLNLVEEYYRKMNDEAMRMFSYLLCICTRETRHIKWSSTCAPL